MKRTRARLVWPALLIGILISGGCITQKVLVITGNEPVLRSSSESERVLGTIIQTEIEGQTDEENITVDSNGGSVDGVRADTDR